MRKKTARRRAPTQARSTFTVDALKQAAAEVIVDAGLEKATTTSISDRAGVSVGTLYQYFSNKEALVAALRHDHERSVFDALNKTATDNSISTPEELMRRMISANIDTHLDNPRLHRVLTVDYPQLGAASKLAICPFKAEFSVLFQTTEARFAASRPALDRQTEIRPILVGVFRLVEALTHALVVDCPPRGSAQELEEIVASASFAYADSIAPNALVP